MPCPNCKSEKVNPIKTLEIKTYRCRECGQRWGDVEQDKTIEVVG